MAAVAGSEAEKLPVVMLFVEKDTRYLCRGRCVSREVHTSGSRRAWEHTARTAGGEDGGTRRLAMMVLAAKEAR